jgi:tetratricopeptide (TPR) repeat protein
LSSTISSNKSSLQRFREADDPGQQAQAWLEAGRLAVRQGNLDEARRLLRSAVRADPDCAEAWLQLAWLTEQPQQRKALLEQVLALEPNHMQAQAELARLDASPSPPAAVRRRSGRQWQRWMLALLVLAAGLALAALLAWGPVDTSLAGLLPTPIPTATPAPTRTPAEIAAQFEPQWQAALFGQNWDRAAEIAAIMLSVDAAGQTTRQHALATYMQYGQSLVPTGQIARALEQFDRAVTLAPDDADVRLWQQISQMYLAGQEAFAAGNWPTAIQVWTEAHARMPDYGDLALRVVEAYRQQGQAALDAGDSATAIQAFTEAVARSPENAELVALLSAAYRLQGQAALDAGDWTAAVQAFTEARARAPENAELGTLLATAYRQRGIAWQKQNKLKNARDDLEAALALQPDDAEAKAHYDDVMYILFPPKRIEIDISKQRFYAWQGDTLVYSFVTSTGIPGRDTAAGHYRVLDKIPMAYSSIWRLKMPYWLGIYYVGNIENGIHALPIRPDGTVMWGGFLGQKASYGCIILSNQAARTIYNWADIGTRVDIHY